MTWDWEGWGHDKARSTGSDGNRMGTCGWIEIPTPILEVKQTNQERAKVKSSWGHYYDARVCEKVNIGTGVPAHLGLRRVNLVDNLTLLPVYCMAHRKCSIILTQWIDGWTVVIICFLYFFLLVVWASRLRALSIRSHSSLLSVA